MTMLSYSLYVLNSSHTDHHCISSKNLLELLQQHLSAALPLSIPTAYDLHGNISSPRTIQLDLHVSHELVCASQLALQMHRP
jgi:hypothetical protein